MKTKSESFIIGRELPVESIAKGIKRQIMGYDGQLMMVKVIFEEGTIGYTHDHFHSQSTYVASGKFEVTIGSKKQILEIGDGFYVEPDISHSVICLETGVLIDVFSPMRLDFLTK